MKYARFAVLVVILIAFCGCVETIYESRDNVATMIKKDGVIVTSEQFLMLIEGKQIDREAIDENVAGKYYIPSKYIKIENGKLSLNAPEIK